jgi:hypothetical protein
MQNFIKHPSDSHTSKVYEHLADLRVLFVYVFFNDLCIPQESQLPLNKLLELKGSDRCGEHKSSGQGSGICPQTFDIVQLY